MRTFSNSQAFVASVTALFAVASQLSLVPVVDAQGAATTVYCGGDFFEYTDCESCLLAECGWSEGTCYSQCAFVLQETCHDLFDPTDSRNATQICAESANHEEDGLICQSITDCETCVNTTKSDNVTTCEWFNISSVLADYEPYCGTGGNNVGLYGQSTCEAPSDRDLIYVDEEDSKEENSEHNLRG